MLSCRRRVCRQARNGASRGERLVEQLYKAGTLLRLHCYLHLCLLAVPCAALTGQPWGSSESTLPSSNFVCRLLARFQLAGALRTYPRDWFRGEHRISRSEAAAALKSVLDSLDRPNTGSDWRSGTWGYRWIDFIYRGRSVSEAVKFLRPELARLGIDVDRELLIEALDRRDLVSVRELRRRVRSPLTQGRYGMTVMMVAAAYGDQALVESELASGAQTEVLDCNGATALFYAAGFGTARVVEQLANAGAVLDANDADWTQRTPLIYAAIGGRVHTTRALLRLGADPMVTANHNRRPSHFVPRTTGYTSAEHRQVLRILLEAEAARGATLSAPARQHR